MNASLEGVKLKIDRANEHLKKLHKEVDDYLNSRPYEVVAKPRPGASALLVCKVYRQPPIKLSLLLGDFLHNLRSSLDHLAWQLVLVNGGTPGKKTAFPILETKGPKPVEIKGGIHPAAAHLVGKLQPYNSCDAPLADPLLTISKLNNIDKHRHFNIAVLNGSEVQIDLMTADGTGMYMTMQFPNAVEKNIPLEDGAAVGVAPFNPGSDQGLRIGVVSMVALQESGEVGPLGTRSIGTVAKNLLKNVRDNVVPEFEKFFIPASQVPVSGKGGSLSSFMENRWRFVAASRRWRASW